MRKVAAAVLAVPVMAAIYMPVLLRREIAIRLGAALAVVGIVFVGALALLPRSAGAVPATTPGPVAQAQFGPIVDARQALDSAMTVSFGSAMDQASVAAALTVEPATQTRLSWEAGGTRLLVNPAGAWLAATYYTVSIGATARDTTGHAIGSPIRASFLTRAATTARISATGASGSVVSSAATFVVTFDGLVDAASARAAFSISPRVLGAITVSGAPDASTAITFRPAKPLTAGATFTVSLTGRVVDSEGATVTPPAALTVTTAAATKIAAAPVVVRFRPLSGTHGVDRTAVLSVRFTRTMNRAATAAAFTVTANGTAVRGTVAWAERDTVLVFTPKAQLPAAATIVMTVGTGARSTSGAALGTRAVGRVTTAAAAKAAAKPKPTPKPKPKPKPIPKPGGGGTGAGSAAWAAVERYYLNLMNCTRGGGLVTSKGACASPGGSGVKPLWIDAGISSRVSRPYAKLLASTRVCSHFDGGTPGDRLRRAGYKSYKWAENLGCLNVSNLYASALGTQIYFQSERSWSPPGGHYVNLMNPLYDRVGIGLWAVHGQVRIVIDFYRP